VKHPFLLGVSHHINIIFFRYLPQKQTSIFFYNFFSNKNGIDWSRAACISRRIASVLGKVAAVHTRVGGRHPGAGALHHRRRSIPPTDAATAAIVVLHIIFCQLFVSPSVGEICTTDVRRNAIRRREYNIFVRICLYICTVCTYNYVCVRVYLFVCACACFLRANRLSSTRNAVRSVKAHASRVYIIIICTVETKKREEKNWML